jgi:hypothetical protein
MMKKKKEAEKFLQENGCGIKFNFKERSVDIPSGGLWYIEPNLKKVYRRKYLFEELPNGNHEIRSYTKWWLPKEWESTPEVNVFFEEIDEIIEYFKKVKKLLNKMGYKTNEKY